MSKNFQAQAHNTATCNATATIFVSEYAAGCHKYFEVIENGQVIHSLLNPAPGTYPIPVACGCGTFDIKVTASVFNCNDPENNLAGTLVAGTLSYPCDDGGGNGGGSGDDDGGGNGGGGGGDNTGQACDIRQAPIALPEDLNPLQNKLQTLNTLRANQVNRLKRLFSIQSGQPTADGVEATLSELEATTQALRDLIESEYDYLMPELPESWNPRSVNQYRVMLDQLAQTVAYYIQQENTYALLFAGFTVALEAEAYAMLARDYIAGLPQTHSDDDGEYAFYDKALENSASVEQMLSWLSNQLTLQQIALANQQQAQQRAIDDLLAEKPKSFEVLSVGPDTGLPSLLGGDFRTLGVTEKPFMPTPYIGGGGGSSGARAFRPASPNGNGHDRSSTLPTLIGTFLVGAVDPLVNAARRIFFNHRHGRRCDNDYSVTNDKQRKTAREILRDELKENGEECLKVNGKTEEAHHIMPLGYEKNNVAQQPNLLKFPGLVDTRANLQQCLKEKNRHGLNSVLNGICLDPDTHHTTKKDIYVDKMNCLIKSAYDQGLQQGGDEKGACDMALQRLKEIKDQQRKIKNQNAALKGKKVIRIDDNLNRNDKGEKIDEGCN